MFETVQWHLHMEHHTSPHPNFRNFETMTPRYKWAMEINLPNLSWRNGDTTPELGTRDSAPYNLNLTSSYHSLCLKNKHLNRKLPESWTLHVLCSFVYFVFLKVIDDINRLRTALTAASNLRVHMASNVDHLRKATQLHLPWQQQFVEEGIKTDVKW